MVRQCELLGLSRSSLYYTPVAEDPYNQELMRLLDEQYTKTPFYGVRRMTEFLRTQGHGVNRKRVRRLLRGMGLEAIYPKRRLSAPGKENRVFPYLLRGVAIRSPDQVWSADITYIRMRRGFVYLMAILDWHSRYVVTWELSTNLESGFCLDALDRALRATRPDVFNTDQGVQFTCEAWIERLQRDEVRISMDGRGRVYDNIFVERLWRTIKYEEVYLKDYEDPEHARKHLAAFIGFYNHERQHQHLGYRTPASVYFSR